MESLKSQRADTQRARDVAAQRSGLTAAQETRKRKLDERRAEIAAKRNKLLGGEQEVARLVAEKRASEADLFLRDVEAEMNK